MSATERSIGDAPGIGQPEFEPEPGSTDEPAAVGAGDAAGEGGEWGSPDAVPDRVPFVVPGDTITRHLCAAVHLKASFANHVHDELVEPAHRGMAPNWSIDTTALARHAEQARERRSVRDLWLLVEFAVVIAVAEWATASFITGRIGPVRLAEVYAAGLLITYAVAFAIVWWHYSAVHRSAVAVLGVRGVEAIEPPALSPEVEEDLASARRANVVLFAGTPPFVGSGTLLDHWTVSVDLSIGATGADGKRQPPETFDGLDLSEALLAALPESINPRPVGGQRLYVVGGHAPVVGGLFRSGPVQHDDGSAIRFRRPVSIVPDDVIKRYLRNPHPSARPYTYFTLTGWDGQVVVTLFLRIVLHHPVLYVEGSVCALRPLSEPFSDAQTIELGPGVHRLPVLRSVLPKAFPLLLGSPMRAYANFRGGRAEVAARKDLEQTLARRADVNFSAGPSLREQVERSGNSNHFGYVDEEMYYGMFNRRSLDCLRDYLKAKKVDVTDFESQQAVIVENTLVNAQKIYGAGDA